MSIPALGGGAAGPGPQRALMDAAERALADELGLLEGESASEGAATTGRGVRRRAAAPAEAEQQVLEEAIVVELGESDAADRLEVAGGWITVPRRGPLETRGEPVPQRLGAPAAAPAAGGVEGEPAPPAGAVAPRVTNPVTNPATNPATARPGAAPVSTGSPAPAPDAAGEAPAQTTDEVPLDRLLVVLKKTGIGFRDAYQVLREISVGEPLPPRAELQARWAAADPAAWEERARAAVPARESAAAQRTPATEATQATQAIEATQRNQLTQAMQADLDLRRTPIDDLIRDRTWHRENPAASTGTTAASDAGPRDTRVDLAGDRPTLASIVREDPTNQAYLAGLSTAEFQRLVTILGKTAPEWFWDLRGHRGVRGLAERRVIARLNTTRIAGTRLGAWILAVLVTAMLWYLGIHTGAWW